MMLKSYSNYAFRYDYETLAGHVATSHTSTLPVGSGLVVVEWSKVKHPPQLQRRAIRLPKIQLTVAAASANPDAGWIWLVHYLSDVGLPPWLPAHMRPEAPVDLSLTTPVKSNAPAVATTAGPVLLQASPPYTVQEEEEEEEAEEEASTVCVCVQCVLKTYPSFRVSLQFRDYDVYTCCLERA